jgi:uncharacterized membrane protein YeaQ/YmgE (transglycosylase-associated protein family)
VGIVSWIVLGAVVGCLVSRVAPARLPGGVWAYCVGGMAGAFVGGGSIALLTGRNAGTIDPLDLVVAVAGAALLVLIVRKAAHAEPRIRAR